MLVTVFRFTDQVGQRMMLGYGGMAASGLAIVAAFGFCAAIGVDFVSIVGTTPFLIVGEYGTPAVYPFLFHRLFCCQSNVAVSNFHFVHRNRQPFLRMFLVLFSRFFINLAVFESNTTADWLNNTV